MVMSKLLDFHVEILFRNAQNAPFKELNFHNFLGPGGEPPDPQIKGSSHVNVSILNVNTLKKLLIF